MAYSINQQRSVLHDAVLGYNKVEKTGRIERQKEKKKSG